ncbi:MAG: response regulator [Clostridia bacterium]|nr:response regulator [Clostridia bacterium]
MCLLIVDDERHVADGLTEMLSPLAEKEGFHIEKAYSGRDALSYAQSNTVRVALLDIRMPGMDGLHLAEALVGLNPDVYLVFLTGHSEFDYAYRAAKFANQSFLLKVESDDVIIKEVKKAFERVTRSEQEKHMLLGAEKNEKVIRCLWRRQALDKAITAGDFSSLAPVGEKKVYLLIGSIQANAYTNDFSLTLLLLEFLSALESMLKNKCEAFLTEKNGAVISALVFPHVDGGGIDGIKAAAEEALKQVNLSNDYFSAFIMWPKAVSAEETVKTIYTMLSLLDHSRTDLCISYAPMGMKNAPANVPEILLEALKDQLLRDRQAEFEKTLGEISNMFSGVTDMHSPVAMETLERIRLMLVKRLNRLGKQQKGEWQEMLGLLSPARNASTWKQAFDNAGSFARALFGEISNTRSTGSDETLSRICDYIIKNIHAPFTLKEMAIALNYNSTYLSRFFKNATGERLFDYIANQRISLAKKLLITTDMRVGDIAVKCGFENAQYFATQFKSAVGMTPSGWRNRQKQM